MRIVTGTVGIGKSTTGYAVAERAAAQGRPAAFLDVDELTEHPSSRSDSVLRRRPSKRG